jgi:adenylate kinase
MTAMNLVLVGAPGSGKGTQAKELVERYRAPQISTGDILRAAVREGTELGKKAQGFMKAGELVPDDLIIDLIRDRLSQPDTEHGFILDGFPRTVPQAEALAGMLKETGRPLTRVVAIDVPREAIIHRITGRRTCANCGNVYHVEFAPPPADGVCTRCGANQIIQRDDDREEAVKVRLDAFEASTAQVIPFYEAAGLLERVDGDRAPADVTQAIVAVLEGAGANTKGIG